MKAILAAIHPIQEVILNSCKPRLILICVLLTPVVRAEVSVLRVAVIHCLNFSMVVDKNSQSACSLNTEATRVNRNIEVENLLYSSKELRQADEKRTTF